MNYTFGAVQADTDYEVEVKMENGSQYFILDGNTLFTRNFTFSTSYQPYIAVI